MSKGFQAVEAATAVTARSKKTYLKHRDGESIKVRIPQNIVDQLTTVKVVDVYNKDPRLGIMTTLSNFAEGNGKTDIYHEAHQLMKEDHFKAQGTEFPKGSDADKASWKAANVLEPKPNFLFGVIPLADFTQGKVTKNTFPAGEPILLSTNLGAGNVNIKALEDVFTDDKFQRKIATKAYEIKAIAANKFTFTPLDDDDLTPEELEVFNATADRLLVDEDFDGAIFESDVEKQLKEVEMLGVDITRLPSAPKGVTIGKEDAEAPFANTDVGADDLPF